MLKALLALPVLTHALLAAAYTAALAAALTALPPIPPAFIAAGLVWAYFYAREAAPREHDLKHQGVSGLAAWLGATFAFRWTPDNLAQWAAPAATAVAVGLAFFFSKFSFVGF